MHNIEKGRHMIALRRKCKHLLSHIPLWMQLALFTTLITFFVLFHLIYTDYKRNLQVITDTQTATSRRLLTMEMQNLEKYIQELSLFCVQSCYDRTFSHIIEKDSSILPGEDTYLKNQIRAYFYSRNDLQSIDFYFINHARKYTRTQNGIRSQIFSVQEAAQSDYYQECFSSPYFHAILPSDDDNIMFHYYHSLLRIKTKQPQALLHIAVTDTFWNSLRANHEYPGEFICLFDENGALLHSGSPDLLSSSETAALTELHNLAGQEAFHYTLNGRTYLVTCAEGSAYHMRLFAFLPTSYIDDQIAEIRYSILFSGLLLTAAVLVLITALIRFLTNPLTILAKKLVNVGKGDFTSPADISGSLEICNLSKSFNDMILHIDELIKKTYIAQLGEKNARITALEAQLNPHFLYNTLQAIATEALLNDQTQIYNMITSLASGLRYTIKGGDYVPLCQEIEYTKNYVNL
ncbi:MAG: histidine kinase [Lachnospiraceae bacterium]|nr:histidine kinase [Lachnospiraceae bacterium]